MDFWARRSRKMVPPSTSAGMIIAWISASAGTTSVSSQRSSEVRCCSISSYWRRKPGIREDPERLPQRRR
jgi:hypothetical protein